MLLNIAVFHHNYDKKPMVFWDVQISLISDIIKCLKLTKICKNLYKLILRLYFLKS